MQVIAEASEGSVSESVQAVELQRDPPQPNKRKLVWPSWLRWLRSWVWDQIEELLEEFSPWLKWLILDAALALIVRALAANCEFLIPYFEAIGWL